MDVEIAIPTCCNDGKTIKFTLQSLAKQTYKDFHLLIVYKPTPNDHTPDVLKPFSRELNMSIIEQTEGGIDDAMNLIFQNATGDILLTTDDDEIPDENWVNDHVLFHERYPNGGAFRGRVKRKSSDVGRRVKFKGLRRLIYSDYSRDFKEYIGYLTVFGLPYDRSDNASPRKGEVMKTITLAYENSSFKRKVYNDFRAPGYSLRGFHGEDLISLHAIKKGFFTGEIDGGWAEEIERTQFGVTNESLSTPASIRGRLGLIAEHFLFPYGAYLEGFTPRRLWLLKPLLSTIRDPLRREASILGLTLAQDAISKRLEPKTVRKMLKSSLDSLYSKFNI